MALRCECGTAACSGDHAKQRKAIHWGGGIRHARGTRLPGWACCCTGERCERISADESVMTRNPHLVTCKACLRWMRKDTHADRWGIFDFEPERGPAKDNTGCDV